MSGPLPVVPPILPMKILRRLSVLACLGLGVSALADGPAEVHFASDYRPTHYDLSGLPIYQPGARILGSIRIYGTPLEGLAGKWMATFRGEYFGQIREQAYLINTSQAFAGLTTGVADVGIMGHRTWLTSRRAFESTYGYAPLEIRIATGSYDEPQPVGTTPGLIFIVNKNNPLSGLTVDQLDGILGAQRTGGWEGTKWSTKYARGADKNIRTWGQLGLTGEWANQPIHPWGSDVTISNWDDLIQQVAFHGGTKWNPAMNEAQRADISLKAKHTNADETIIHAVLDDKFAIGFMFQRVINRMHADVKVIPIAKEAGGPYIMPSTQSFFDGSYAFRNGGYIYLNRPPGQPVNPREKEFVKFILSREGQQIIADDRQFIPLNAEDVKKELKKLD